MIKLNKAKTWMLSAVALGLVAVTSVPASMAYFTANDQAPGGVLLNLSQSDMRVNESFQNWTKTVQLENTSATGTPCYSRIKIFGPDTAKLKYEYGAKWSLGKDGYYYYSDVLWKKGDVTDEFKIKIDKQPLIEGKGIEFDVIVVQESVPVKYKEDGSTYADWTMDITKHLDEYKSDGKGAK